MIEQVTIFPIGQAPTTFIVGTGNVAGIEVSGTAGAVWYCQVMYDDGHMVQFVGVPYQANYTA